MNLPVERGIRPSSVHRPWLGKSPHIRQYVSVSSTAGYRCRYHRIYVAKRTHASVDQGDSEDEPIASSSASSEDQSSRVKDVAFQKTTMNVYSSVVSAIKENIHVLLCVYVLTEGVQFLTNRIFHRVTNELAMNMLYIPREVIGNVWWLSQNMSPELVGSSQYQALTGLVFFLAFPLSVLIKAIQSIYMYQVLFSDSKDVKGVKGSLGWCRDTWPEVKRVIGRVIPVEFLVSLVVIPLQFASLLVFSLPFTLPIIMSVHVALPVAIQEEKRGWDAIRESRALMKPILWQAAIPFVSIIVCQRLIDVLQGKIIASLPGRFYYELLEVPLGIVTLGFASSLLVALARQVLPFSLYKLVKSSE